MVTDYESLATGRASSVFQQDVDRNAAALVDALGGRSVAVVGAAGSIGSAVVKDLLRYRPAELAVIDLSENNLVELVRDLRSSAEIDLPRGFAALPVGLGSPECGRFFAESGPFDYVFNLCAVKHVRSEKDVFSVMRMVETNVLALDELLRHLPSRHTKVFSVSTDKATNPASLMGASKRTMEMVLIRHSERNIFSTARFANVAFSDGSLPFGFLKRIEKRQPIAAPSDVQRFFISHREAGQLCLLAGALGGNREAFFPKLEAGVHERSLREIAVALLVKLGFEPCECASEEEARARASELIAQRKWPCLFAPSDTSGEKQHEEFFAAEDDVDWSRFEAIGIVRHAAGSVDPAAVQRFIDFATAARRREATKAEYVEAFEALMPSFRHLETGRSLDEKL